MGRYEQAIEDYTDAIRLDRDYAEAYNSRATVSYTHLTLPTILLV